jgi:hypothetical protein
MRTTGAHWSKKEKKEFERLWNMRSDISRDDKLRLIIRNMKDKDVTAVVDYCKKVLHGHVQLVSLTEIVLS